MALSWITLSARRGIALSDLRLSSTYAGLLEGVPTRGVNDRIVAARLRAAGEAYPGRPVHLVPPVRTEREGSTTRRGEPVEYLPAVACIGLFDSDEIDPAHDSGWYFSELAVVWFQPDPDLPSTANDPAGLRDLAWVELARDYER